jgi:hypothetical protein
MKKILLFSFLFLSGLFTTQAQTINNIPIRDIDIEYILIIGTAVGTAFQSVQIDLGRENKTFTRQQPTVRDSNGKWVHFVTMTDALNFMTKNGYDFVQAYTFTEENKNYCHYLLRKNKPFNARMATDSSNAMR